MTEEKRMIIENIVHNKTEDFLPINNNFLKLLLKITERYFDKKCFE